MRSICRLFARTFADRLSPLFKYVLVGLFLLRDRDRKNAFVVDDVRHMLRVVDNVRNVLSARLTLY